MGIGFSKNAMNKEHLRYTYENADQFGAFPTTSLIVCHRGPMAEGNMDLPGIPAFNPMMLLHGEETLTIETPVKPDVNYEVVERLVDV